MMAAAAMMLDTLSGCNEAAAFNTLRTDRLDDDGSKPDGTQTHKFNTDGNNNIGKQSGGQLYPWASMTYIMRLALTKMDHKSI